MRKLQLASAVITTVLFTSNLTLMYQYKHDMNKYEHKISSQSKLIEQFKIRNAKMTDSIRSKEKEIHSLRDLLDQVKKENEQLKQQRVLNITATAYTASCRGCSGITYSGYPVNNTIEYNGYRIVAMDTKLVPLYSIVKIDTKNTSMNAIVLDKGGAIKGHKMDLLVNSYDKAIEFGKQDVKVTILREGEG